MQVPKVAGGSLLSIKVSWSQRLLYRDGCFCLHFPFSFPSYVNPIGKTSKIEKIVLNFNSGNGTEVTCECASHPFKLQLQSLMETLSSTEPHYIRCVKPNNVLKPAIFENVNIIQQLRCGGVLEAIRISCAGNRTRRTFYEFLLRFGLLAPEVLDGNYDDKVACQMILDKMGLNAINKVLISSTQPPLPRKPFSDSHLLH